MNAVALYEYLACEPVVPTKLRREDYLLDLRENLYFCGRRVATQVAYFSAGFYVRGKTVFTLDSEREVICELEHTPVAFFVFENNDCAILRDGSVVELRSGRELLSLRRDPGSFFGSPRHLSISRVAGDIPTTMEYSSEFSYHGVELQQLNDIESHFDVLHRAESLFNGGMHWNAKLLLFSLCLALGDKIHSVLDAYFSVRENRTRCCAFLDTLLFLAEFNGYVYLYDNN